MLCGWKHFRQRVQYLKRPEVGWCMESRVGELTRVQGACGPPNWLVVPSPTGFKTSLCFCWCHSLFKSPHRPLGFPGGSVVKMQVGPLGWEHPLEDVMATHSNILTRELLLGSTWWTAVLGVTRSRTRLKQLSTHNYLCHL